MGIVKIFNKILLLISIFSWIDAEAEDITSYHLDSASNPIREKMDLINSEDLAILEDFFRYLFKSDGFAYTLFGPKPMTFIGYDLAYRGVVFSKNMKTDILIEILGLKIWQKYSHLFSSKNFYFQTSVFQDNSTNIFYIIVNKQRCEEILTQHHLIFQECLEKEQTIPEILESIYSSSFLSSLYHNKKGYAICLGLLLGYGKKNSALFEKRSILLIQSLKKAPYHLAGLNENMKANQGYFHLGLQSKLSIKGIEQPISIQQTIEELNALQQIYRPIALVERDHLCPLGEVRCAGMSDDPEAKALRVQYESVCQDLVDIYNSDNFLEIVLTQLSS